MHACQAKSVCTILWWYWVWPGWYANPKPTALQALDLNLKLRCLIDHFQYLTSYKFIMVLHLLIDCMLLSNWLANWTFLWRLLPIQYHCCGASDFQDWETNIYFNCSSPAQSRCGVPMSCCKNFHGNLHCGYHTRQLSVTLQTPCSFLRKSKV